MKILKLVCFLGLCLLLGAQACLVAFDSAPAGTEHHRGTLLFLQPGSTNRSFVEGIARNDTITGDEPGANEFVARVASLKFMDIVERSVEGRHSVVHRFSSFRPTKLCKLSNRLRSPELERNILSDPELFSQFVRCMGRARNPLSLAHHLGLTKHPALQGINQGHKVGRYNLTKIVRDIVYRVEHVGQHLDV